MTPTEIVSLLTSIGALALAVYAAVKAHTPAIVEADKLITQVTADPVLLHTIDKLASSLPPEAIKLFKDAGILITTVAEDNTPRA